MNDVEALLDLAFFERQTFGEAALARDVLLLFREQAQRLFPELAGAGRDRQTEVAHLLKGSCQGIGARRAATMLRRFDAADAAERLGLLPPLRETFDALDDAIAAHLDAL